MIDGAHIVILEIAALKKAGVACEEPSQQSWGRLTRAALRDSGHLLGSVPAGGGPSDSIR